MGAGSSSKLMSCLQQHPAIRSLGMVTYYNEKGYDEQALQYIQEGKVNTMFIDPGNTGENHGHFDAAPYIKKIRQEFPNVIFIIYTWPECWEKFTKINPEFSHYFYLCNMHWDKDGLSNELNVILDLCQNWFQTRYEYDIALSFSGEDRQLAEELATKLKNEGVKVFYDRDEKANLLGKNLVDYLYDIYCNKSRYCVLLSSRSYAQKMWTSHERRSAQERALKERGNEFILPIRIDNTSLPGMSGSIGYIESIEGADKIAATIIQKLWMTDPDQKKKFLGRSMY